MSWKFNPFTGKLDSVIDNATGDTGTIVEQKICSETISALKIVTPIDDTQVKISSNLSFNDSQAIGIAISSGNIGDTINVLLFGQHDDASFLFANGLPLFMNGSGIITSTPQTIGYNVRVGHSLGNGAIFISIKEQIKL